jgi:glutathione peroxidase
MGEPTSTTTTTAASLHTLRATRLDGTDEPLSSYAGRVLLVVNTASECGFTPQYEPLQAVHAKYKDRGFSVLAFPSNDFGEQEPGSAKEIAAFCTSKYGVTFPLFEKVKTKGDGQSPIYKVLADAKGPPKWNFHKYLVDKTGRVVAAWPSSVKPDSREITEAIEGQLAK